MVAELDGYLYYNNYTKIVIRTDTNTGNLLGIIQVMEFTPLSNNDSRGYNITVKTYN